MRMLKMEKVEWEDVQGLLSSGFLRLPFAAYILLRFVPGATVETKAWLGGLAERLMRADGEDEAEPSRPRSVRTMKKYIKEMKPPGGGTPAIDVAAVNFALTASGLKSLGVERSELAQFSSEFCEGMAPPMVGGVVPRRSNVLGDIGDSSPACWEWGGWNAHQTIDGLLLLFAADPQSLQALVARELALMAGAAEALLRLDGHYEGKEHFGFKDGISQPIIEDTERTNAKQKRISVVKPGEFVLGYLNERNARIKFSGAHERDLGRNGTYLVFRQLEQDVPAFNAFISDTIKLLYGTVNVDPQAKELVAARLIGRYRSGEPLVPPAADSRGPPEERNDFLYHFEDRFGLACPIGAHIRRANPRDDAIGPDPDTALRLSKMHRIIRRGRLYGERLDPSAKNEASSRGLYFICLNADIAGQFEMVQHSWMNGAHFNGLHHETDCMSHYPPSDGTMTIQHRPTNMRIPVPKFVTVRGGAYFFLPGVRALQSLAQAHSGRVTPFPGASVSPR
jgi:Dyp-type peroxidase family